MIRLLWIALFTLSCTASADFIDSQGREWMRVDSTFAFAGQLPQLCNPVCTGVVTRYTYDVRLNTMTNPQQISLDGYTWASKDDVQWIYESVNYNFLSLFGVSSQFVTTYSYSAGLNGSTSSVDEATGQRYYFSYGEGHNMVSFSAGGGFQLGSANLYGQVGGFLYRATAQVKNCAFNGKVVLNGQSVQAFPSATVPFGNSCVSETRVCSNGVLSGSATNASCTVNAPLSCNYNGQTIEHGASVSGFLESIAAYGTSCQSVTRTCYNGSLGGSIVPSCSVASTPPTPPGYRCKWRKSVWYCEKR